VLPHIALVFQVSFEGVNVVVNWTFDVFLKRIDLAGRLPLLPRDQLVQHRQRSGFIAGQRHSLLAAA